MKTNREIFKTLSKLTANVNENDKLTKVKLKKSRIIDWWVADSNSKMAFVNILSGELLSTHLYVVGYLDKNKKELGTSTNRVVKIVEDGVLTVMGTFYPFKKAHKLYLNFLMEANKEDTVIATNWEYSYQMDKGTITADIIRNGNIEKNVTFDFIPRPEYSVAFLGYSKKLSCKVVLTTFDKRNVCMKIGIPDEVKFDIYRSSL